MRLLTTTSVDVIDGEHDATDAERVHQARPRGQT